MKKNLLSGVVLLHLFLWGGLLQSDGFAEKTLVREQWGLKPIEQFVAGNCVVVVSAAGDVQPYSVTHTMSYVADCFIKIQINDICVCAAPDQKFYSCNTNQWVSAQALNVSDQLLCASGKTVCVSAVEVVHKQQKMHAFSVDTSHIFCVTPYEIIAHNINPAAIVALSVACPPAGIAVAVAQVTALSVLGGIFYCAHRKAHRAEKVFSKCFSSDSAHNGVHDSKMPTGCYQSVPDYPLVCDIGASKQTETEKVIPYINPEVFDDKYEFPIEVVTLPIMHYETTGLDDTGENKRYDGPVYSRTEDWIKDHPFGQKIKNFLKRTDHIKQGKRAFKVIEKIEGCYGFNKGDYIVVDGLHKDHLEVYGSNRKWKQVANFDGTKNENKTEQGKEEPRQPL